MSESFSSYAANYDTDFSNTEIGKLQRSRVWFFLERNLEGKPLKILELNCGTGIDAMWFAKKGCNILATDISPEMVNRAAENTLAFKDKVKTITCDCRTILEVTGKEKFDIVFSNFSGLNCLAHAELSDLSNSIKNVLKPDGKFIACFFGTKCWWEKLYFFFKFNFKEMNRRKDKKAVQVKIEDEAFTTWYYSTSTINKIFSNNFMLRDKMPVGIFIPPSYLNSFFRKFPFVLKILYKMECVFSFPFLSNYADHYVVCLTQK